MKISTRLLKLLKKRIKTVLKGFTFFSEIKLFDFVKSIQYYAREDALKEIDDRLMPEGAEWPKFEDGEPVLVGDEFETMVSGTKIVDAIKFEDGFIFSLEFNNGCDTAKFYKNERAKRPKHMETLQDVIDDLYKQVPNQEFGHIIRVPIDLIGRLKAIQERIGGDQ